MPAGPSVEGQQHPQQQQEQEASDESTPPPPSHQSPSCAAEEDGSSRRATTTLYLAGVGEAVGTDMEELRRALEAFGPLDDHEGNHAGSAAIKTFPGKGYLLARFRDAGGAARAQEGLDGRVLQGRPLTVQFSTVSDNEEGAAGRPPPEPLDPGDCEGVTIPGLQLVEAFLSPEEEAALLAFANRHAGAHWVVGKEGMGRRVQHYGHRFNYASRGVDFDIPCPSLPWHECPVFAAVVARMLSVGLLRMAPDQMTLNEYLPGQGIAGHVETHDAFRDGILSLSLNGPVVMDFREPATSQRKALLLPARSALALHGEARYLWTHAIAGRTWDKVNNARHPRTSRRISFTLRRVIPPLPGPGESRRPCLCPFPDRCPTSPLEARAAYLAACKRGGGAGVSPPDARKPTPLERANVHAVYETISAHWNHTRAIRRVHWPRVVKFLQALPPHALIADIGCGDGKYLAMRRYHFHPTAFAMGCDRSLRLLACARQQGGGEGEEEPKPPEVFACDVLQVPFRDNAFDAALCIAVLHHLSTEAHRVQALRELFRVVRVGGVVDIHVWALEQEEGGRRRFDGQDQLVPFKMHAKYAPQPLNTLVAACSSSPSSSSASTAAINAAPSPPSPASALTAITNALSTSTSHDEEVIKDAPPPIVEAVPASVDQDAQLLTYERYCHVFREWELESLLNQLGNELELELLDRGYDKGNWFVTVRKVGEALL